MAGTSSSYSGYESRVFHPFNSTKRTAETLSVVPHPADFAPLAFFVTIAFAVIFLLLVMWCVQCLGSSHSDDHDDDEPEALKEVVVEVKPRRSHHTSDGHNSSFSASSFGDIVAYEVVRSSLTEETDSVFLRDFSEPNTAVPQDAIPTPVSACSVPSVDIRYGLHTQKPFIVERVPEPSPRAFVF